MYADTLHQLCRENPYRLCGLHFYFRRVNIRIVEESNGSLGLLDSLVANEAETAEMAAPV
jgi:hypothetical protein